MVDVKNLDKKLTEIIEKKNQLSKLNYDSNNYDQIEEELHDLEDDFIEEFGDYLEEALHSVHDEFCPDNDVLLPIAYLATSYEKDDQGNFVCKPNDGVFVDADDFNSTNTRLVLVPNPTRLVLNIGGGQSQVVWAAE